MVQYQIDGYGLGVWSSRSTTNLNPSTAATGIYLYEGNTYRGRAIFHADGTALPAPFHDSTSGRVTLRFNLSQFHAVMEMLRTEEPIYLYYYGSASAGLRSGKEPVGEEEEE